LDRITMTKAVPSSIRSRRLLVDAHHHRIWRTSLREPNGERYRRERSGSGRRLRSRLRRGESWYFYGAVRLSATAICVRGPRRLFRRGGGKWYMISSESLFPLLGMCWQRGVRVIRKRKIMYHLQRRRTLHYITLQRPFTACCIIHLVIIIICPQWR
jgi:hypothetical protein